MKCRSFIISALSGGAGKTVISIGITAALRRQGYPVTAFKKGPDYIDAGWLTLASGRPCYNLDPFLFSSHDIIQSFRSHATPGGIVVVEGNRGLFDSIDVEGTTSTAELAKTLKCPVILCLDCTKTTRTMAAVVSGCIQFDKDVHIEGVILNRVAGARHENILRTSIETHCRIPVLGALPRLRDFEFPERHMGLVPTPEHLWATQAIESAAQIAETHMDLKAIIDGAGHVDLAHDPNIMSSEICNDLPLKERPIIGVIRDSAFQFYYPDNIEALVRLGAEIKYINALSDDSLPDLDALYIGGGFPETHAARLASNRGFRAGLKSLAENGLPVYAECGGLMYLGEELVVESGTYPMVGFFPAVFGISPKPQGHGYAVARVDRINPYFPVGAEIRGHEFRYSKVLKWSGAENDFVLSTTRGTGFIDKRDGMCRRRVFASYMHLHALGTPEWAPALVRNAITYRNEKRGIANGADSHIG